MAKIGIDFGTTKTIVSYCNPTSGDVEIVNLGRSGNAAIPTTAYVSPKGEFLFGDEADDKMEEDPEGYCRAFKLELGEDSLPALARTMDDGSEKVWTAEELAHQFLSNLRKRVGQEIPFLKNCGECTITVPVSCGEGTVWRASLKKAAKKAGFEKIDFMPEPVAAGRAYLRDVEGAAFSRAMVFDWGGGTLDVSVVSRRNDGTFRADLRSAGGCDDVGGEEMDILLARKVVEGWMEANGNSPFSGNELLGMLCCRREAKKCKEALSSAEQHFLSLASRKRVKVSRKQFEELIAPLVSNAVELAQRTLRSDCRRNPAPDIVLLVGGSCGIPYVRRSVEKAFPDIPVKTWENAAVAVPLGALDLPEWEEGRPHPLNSAEEKVLSGAERGKWVTSPGYQLVLSQNGIPKAKWKSGLTDGRCPGMVSAAGESCWDLLPGYRWCVRGMSAQWVAGKLHPSVAHCLTTKTEGVWEAEPGYSMVNFTAPERGVLWNPGARYDSSPHVFAGKEEGIWEADVGYSIIDRSSSPPFAKWVPGKDVKGHPHIRTAKEEGNFRAQWGWVWASKDDDDLRVVPDPNLRLCQEIESAFKDVPSPWLHMPGNTPNFSEWNCNRIRSGMGVPSSARVVAIFDDSYGNPGARGFIVAEEGVFLNARVGPAIFFNSTGALCFPWKSIKTVGCIEGNLVINGKYYQMGMFLQNVWRPMDRAFKRLLSRRELN